VTAAVLDRPCTEPADHGPVTLQELLDCTLHAARTTGSAVCPVCHARMTSTRAGAREAECGDCGSRLS
jgi:tRNA(Ile2) C34 agmatinyltransferase TiaS